MADDTLPTPDPAQQDSHPLMSELLKRAALTQPLQTVAPPQMPHAGVGKMAPLAYLGGAAADMGTTAYFNAHPELGMHEKNPLVNWAPKGAQLPIGAGMELGAVLLGHKLLQNHPTIAKALLMGAGALHGGAAVNNLREIMNPPPAAPTGAKDITAGLAGLNK